MKKKGDIYKGFDLFGTFLAALLITFLLFCFSEAYWLLLFWCILPFLPYRKYKVIGDD